MKLIKVTLGKDALVISILTLTTVLVWMAFDIYYALTQTEIPQVLQKQLAPLNPKLSSTTFENLEKRINYSVENLDEVVIVPPVTESAIMEEAVEAEPVATEAGRGAVEEETTGETATESGILE